MKLIILTILLSAGMASQAQLLDPVKWTFSAMPVKGKAGVHEVRMTAAIEKGWTIYSQSTPRGGPAPTIVVFKANPLVLLDGKVKEAGGMKKKHEEVFGVDVHYYSDSVTFVQLVKLKKPGVKTTLSGTVEFMACDDTQCLPPHEVAFSVELK